MAMNVACRMADTGVLAATRQPPVIGNKLDQQDYVVNLVANEGLGVWKLWLASGGELAVARTSLFGSRRQGERAGVGSSAACRKRISKGSRATHPAPVPLRAQPGSAGNCTGAAKVYKAGPLSGAFGPPLRTCTTAPSPASTSCCFPPVSALNIQSRQPRVRSPKRRLRLGYRNLRRSTPAP